ncbi:copia protein [Tanacetum coccineum]
MTTLAEHVIVAGAENRPPMLEKSMYDSWASHIRLFIKGRNMRFSQLINDMHTIGMTMQQVQVNTKFLNALPPEWSKFLNAYLNQHERHANEERIMHERYPDPLALVANSQTLYNPSESPQHSATIQDGRVIVQQIQGRQTQSFAGSGNRGIVTTLRGNYAASQPKVVKCYNCQGEGHMTRQCTQPKRPRNAAWFKDKLMLAEAQKADFQTKDLDAYDSDCDDLSSAKSVLIANLSSCDSDVLCEESQDAVIQDTNSSTPNDLLVLSLVEQITDHIANLDKEKSDK